MLLTPTLSSDFGKTGNASVSLPLGKSSLPHNWARWLVIALGLYIIILVLTRPADYVDSMSYAKHIVDHQEHRAAPNNDPLWEFGHPLWRPLGLVVWSLFRGPLDAPFGGEKIFGVLSGLVALNILGGLIAVALMFMLLARIGRSAPVAALLATGFAATNAIINYSQTGMAYVVGIACQLAGLYLICRAIQREQLALKQAILAAVPLGLSIAIWFPYILPMAGLLCFALLWTTDGKPPVWKRRAVFTLQIGAGIAALVVLSYIGVMTAAHIHSVDNARQWVARARHEIQPTRGVLRTVGGIPRGFFWLGGGSTVWKEKLFGGGRSHISAGDLLRAGIWKLALVYAILLLTCIQLWKSVRGRALMICLAVAAVPVLWFAAFVFDPSPPERFLALFPLLFCGFAIILSDRNSISARIAIPVFVVAMLAVNCSAMLRFRAEPQMQQVAVRLQTIVPKMGPNDYVLALASTEGTFRFLAEHPFAPESRTQFQFYPVIEKNTIKLVTWRQRAADLMLNVWRSGGHVWLSRQLLAQTPKLEWNWVEGDDPRIRWPELPAFFGQLQLGEPFGGPDGFVEVLPSDKNKQLLQNAAQTGNTGLNSPAGYPKS